MGHLTPMLTSGQKRKVGRPANARRHIPTAPLIMNGYPAVAGGAQYAGPYQGPVYGPSIKLRPSMKWS